MDGVTETGLMAKWKAWRLDRAMLSLGDAAEHLSEWRFGMTHSQIVHLERRIEKLKARVRSLGGDPEEAPYV